MRDSLALRLRRTEKLQDRLLKTRAFGSIPITAIAVNAVQINSICVRKGSVAFRINLPYFVFISSKQITLLQFSEAKLWKAQGS